ncbi:uncharacterized protein [Dermacentor albipictus]|uniref:uncharacterized protein n=1 Tax=Dermacentor albipictus TaxID=60249 RepID=UPI0038FC8782
MALFENFHCLTNESWVLGLRSKFKNMRKKTEHPSEEMETIKRKVHHTGTKVPPSSGANKKLCRLFDCSHLVVRGESLDSIMRHNEWLHNNPNCRDEDMLRPRLLATAQERHERLKSMALAEALTLYPFLSTEVSLLVEFETLFKRAAVDCVQDGCTKMGKVILDKGTSEEAAAFSEVASEEPVLAVLEFVAARCREQLDTILTTEATELTPCLVRSSDQALDLFVDGQRLFAVSNLLEGVACLFASFWVFHIEYPKKACKLLTFLEHGFMGLSHTKPRVKALELINFFKAHKQ